MKRIIYANESGGVSVIIPAPDCDLTIEQIADKDVPYGASFEIVDASDIPSDRTFRNAWLHDTTPASQKIGVDMGKAKPIAHDKRRAARASEFAPLDIEATIPAKAQQAEVARQAIRDKYDAMQTAIDAATTVDELKQAAASVL
jgi:hypothetical protein